MKKFLLFFFIALSTTILHAQVTTSSMNGVISSNTGEPLAGATVKVTHRPTGTVYAVSSANDGRFNIANMRVGGPYLVEVTYIGSEPKTLDNIYLQLGQPYVLNTALSGGTTLEQVVVSATGSKLNTDRTGASTNVNSKQLQELPQITRSITEFTRLTPQASGNSFAGRDARYNNVQIDGANFNNRFGTASGLLPGGSTQPISLDAIEEIQVNIAPYDVRESGFTGAGVNAVTRSGTNEFHGSAYGFYNNQNLRGHRIGDITLDRQEAYTANYGFRLGGPIIKNKLFFFVNAEIEQQGGANASGANLWRPSTDGIADGENNIARTTVDDLEAVRSHLINTWGYDPGRYQGYANEARQNSYKFMARLDWNINENNNFNIRYNQAIGSVLSQANGTSGPYPRSQTNRISQNSITFENGNYSTENKVHSLSAELNSRINSNLSNQFIAAYTRIQAVRGTPSNQLFPFVDIGDGVGYPDSYSNYMSFGTELFSYNNDVLNNNYNFVNNLTYSKGKHTMTFGAAFEIQNFGNSYTRMGTSYYRYSSVADFLTTGTDREVPPITYGLTYPYEGQDTYARINFGLASLYAQDRYDVSDRFTLTYGLRAELPIYMNRLTPNHAIDAITLLNQYNAPTNYSSGSWPKSRILWSPRVGFNYDVRGDRTLVIRGGTGMFSGTVPFVWLTNMPTNSGVLQNTIEPGNYAQVAPWIGNVTFNPDAYHYVNNPPAGGENVFITTLEGGAPSSFSLVDENFRMPMVWRTSIGGDYSIPNTPLVLNADLLYTKDINAVFQYGANRAVPTTRLNYGASEDVEGDYGDNRLFYPTGVQRYNTAIGANNATILTNTSVKGYAYSATVGVTLPNYRGINASLHYTYSNAKEVSANAGSNASSAWGGSPSINSPNDQILMPSAFAIPHRVVGTLNYRIEYANALATTLGIVYSGEHQNRFSYTYTSDINRDGIVADLVYLPNDLSNLNFVDRVNATGQVLFTAEEQRSALQDFINANGLAKYQGSYLPRNGFLMPWLNHFDVRVLQDIYKNIGTKRHTLQISFDVINFGNLLNKSWGVQSNLNNAQFLLGNSLTPGVNSQGNPVLNTVATPASGNPTLNMNVINGEIPMTPFQNASTISTTWRMQLGLRYIF
ncbi:carboxypeptidase regulatory-like domain-containing protein [Sphingobacterium oryzagri]|uniref:Carboxypeptidase regulatory-like domain-containing protein n=1 Tax=Sphingobacterium oryzagri TaxID=3025669 RepID=A0ABY7WJ58_9SPHI|nr:carboxypeptidase regulatory-like domain-containing protein [Sphingobacterium sp. KACC 22765]WDF68634.1 carboxypeptidase regulatory-like domain-containing protein [Sphingobacterium sp. KACC 22765]